MRDFKTEEIQGNLYHERFRPRFHFSPATGWNNDPNGLIYYEGEYHLFYQYNPFDIVWGPMYWAHAVSEDMIRWKNLPVALEPDALGTIFSGTVVVDWRDATGFFGGGHGLVAIFTQHQPGNECQSIAYSLDKGRTWTKYAGNPVLRPEAGKEYKDFRDPKVFWSDRREKWIMILGGGIYRVYSSDNLKDWTYESSPGIWEEFPDLFRLPVTGEPGAKKWVLATAGYGYYVGEFDGFRFRAEQPYQTADYGRSWQAAYCFENMPGEGRCAWMAWMRDAGLGPTFPWRGNFSVPRELALKHTPTGYVMTQWPVKELENLYGEQFAFDDVPLAPGVNPLAALSGNAFDLDAEFAFEGDAEFGVAFFMGGEARCEAKYVPHAQIAVVDVLHASAPDCAPFETPFRFNLRGDVKILAKTSDAFLPAPGKILRIRVVADVSAVEVFFADGEVAFTHSVYPSAECRGIGAFSCGEGVTLKTCRVRYMKSLWE